MRLDMFFALMPVPQARESLALAYERNVEGDQARDRSGNHRRGPGSIAPVALRLPLVLSSWSAGRGLLTRAEAVKRAGVVPVKHTELKGEEQ